MWSNVGPFEWPLLASFKKIILSSLWSFIAIFLSMVETCVYNSYILWLTKLKCFREISSKTKTKGHFTCVCQTDHLFTKQRASELMIWLRYAIEVKYFLYCADIVLPTAYLESQISESFFFSKLMSMFRE